MFRNISERRCVEIFFGHLPPQGCKIGEVCPQCYQFTNSKASRFGRFFRKDQVSSGGYVTWFIAIFLTAGLGFGQEENRRNQFPGSRAPALGGAFTALADDPSGAYYNPAGLVFAKETDLSVSATALSRTSIRYRGVVQDRDFVEESKAFFPIFAGSSMRIGNFAFGYSYMTTLSRNIDQTTQWREISTVENQARDWNRYSLENHTYLLAGASAAARIGKFSLGVTAYYYSRDRKVMDHQLTIYNNGVTATQVLKITTSNTGMLWIPGVIWRGKSFSIGLSYRSAQALTNETIATLDAVSHSSAADPVVVSVTERDSTFSELNPPTLSTGVAWFAFDRLTIAADLLYHFGVANDFVTLQDTVDASLGAEVGVTKKVHWRLGCFTNRSMNPELSIDKTGQRTKLDYVGGASGLSIDYDRYQGSLTYYLQQGTGRSQILQNAAAIQEVDAFTSTLMVGARYTL
jgi:long-chain fatty acid transport protein